MYIQLVSLHGLVRGENIEMGRDADTGGQVRYVIELARNLATFPEVTQVDLFTRRIRDKRVSPDYAEHIEQLAPNCRLVRLSCGGGRYVRKERLWPFLDEYVDAMISFTRREGRMPTIVHGHYADAGYVARHVASSFGLPFVFTGHSLGRPKLEYLLAEGWTHDEANRELNIDTRMAEEQNCLAEADLVITSTTHERDNQYGKYHRDEKLGFKVIPPGTDLKRFFPYYEYKISGFEVDERFKQSRARMFREFERFHFHPEKPVVLAVCRPDRRKNIAGLIRAYGRNKELQALANLAIFAGIRENIEDMEDNEQQVLTDILLMMDRYDLYGKLAIPKRHDSEFDIPELYRIAAERRGVFVNSAFIELFGLTAIEASAVGLPFVATTDGGPRDIVANCESGLLVDTSDDEALSQAIQTVLTDPELWDTFSTNGINRVREHYSWKTHCARYLDAVRHIVKKPPRAPAVGGRAPGRRLGSVDAMLITDIDNTLLGDDEALARLRDLLKSNRGHVGFGVASGRALELVKDALEENGIDDIDVIIAAVGSEIYYGNDHAIDKGWISHLRSKWRPDRIREALDRLPFLTLQDEPYAQREFKISYYLDDQVPADDALAAIHDAMARARVAYKLIFSHGALIDILPYRASKGKAVRYLAGKWHVPIERIATAGDSGNDRDMLMGRTAGIVVANHSEELASLRESKAHRVYFTEASHAGGIIEGLERYGLLEPLKRPAPKESPKKGPKAAQAGSDAPGPSGDQDETKAALT